MVLFVLTPKRKAARGTGRGDSGLLRPYLAHRLTFKNQKRTKDCKSSPDPPPVPFGGWGLRWVPGAPSAALGPLGPGVLGMPQLGGCPSPRPPSGSCLARGLEKAVPRAVSHLSSGSPCSPPPPPPAQSPGTGHSQAGSIFLWLLASEF